MHEEHEHEETTAAPEAVARLTRDQAKAAATLSADEARFLVDAYYTHQEYRIQADNQVRALNESGEPHAVLAWLAEQAGSLERQIARALDVYSMGKREGRWLRSVYGIGPVIAAGLMAHIDPMRAQTAGAIWRLAGLDPSVTWPSQAEAMAWLKAREWEDSEEMIIEAARHFGRDVSTLRRELTVAGVGVPACAKQLAKRPWNGRLKVLCWKIAESFKKFSTREECIYGHLYRERKALEVERNESGALAENAAQKLANAKARKARMSAEMRATWESGKLQAGGLDARAGRYAVKLFLAHYHAVIFEIYRGQKPPKPYILTQDQGHTHMMQPPGWPCE